MISLKTIVFASLMMSLNYGWAQTLSYSPGQTLNKTVSQAYYDSDFIYFTNISDKALEFEFSLLDNSFANEWSASFCTNLTCYNKIPKAGSLGTLAPGDQGYFLFNLAANETTGNGEVRILITSEQDASLSDTVRFNYTVTEDGAIEAGPWAKVNFDQGIFTVLLAQINIETNLMITNLEGKIIYNEKLSAITSVPLRDHPKGVYVFKIEDASGRILKDKVLNF